MTIGILETGTAPASLRPRFGTFPDMFKALIGQAHDYRVFNVEAGELPGPGEACEAYVITGSAAGAYEALPWITAFGAFLNEVKGNAKLVGVCFGHQMMAQAFGGRVVKSPKGWGVGLQTYEITSAEPWMDDAKPVAIAVSHQDQVVAVPPGARVIGGNAFTPMGLIAYDDQPAISMQCHPEFTPDYARALLETRWAALNLGAEGEAALRSLSAPNDRERVAGWIRNFLG
jgi:GMP synthase-like glutamine amidotransferase